MALRVGVGDGVGAGLVELGDGARGGCVVLGITISVAAGSAAGSNVAVGSMAVLVGDGTPVLVGGGGNRGSVGYGVGDPYAVDGVAVLGGLTSAGSVNHWIIPTSTMAVPAPVSNRAKASVNRRVTAWSR